LWLFIVVVAVFVFVVDTQLLLSLLLLWESFPHPHGQIGPREAAGLYGAGFVGHDTGGLWFSSEHDISESDSSSR
jgi:hypothetical protein